MKIGIIGLGIVGGTVKVGMEELGHDVLTHDTRHYTSIEDVKNTEICYVCVPTPSMKNGKCNTHIVEDVVSELDNINYKGLIAVKSTIEPGTTDKLRKDYPNRNFAFVPEFLRERCAVTDFTENHDVCIIGVYDDDSFELVKESHGHYPQKFVKVTPKEAEFCKYFNNIYNATLITFANSFYEVCNASGVDYKNVKNAIVDRNHINNIYLDCNKNFRGFGGVCLPKDTKAINNLCEELDLDVNFFKNILEENKKYRVTVPKGMRKE
tara:strand:- start:1263 stop:2060 length:798 start_codon:yes stop_codon:yes gene_type:complete